MLDRRNFLRDAAVGSGLLLAGPLHALLARGGSAAHAAAGYGPIAPVADQRTGLALLALPADVPWGDRCHSQLVRRTTRGPDSCVASTYRCFFVELGGSQRLAVIESATSGWQLFQDDTGRFQNGTLRLAGQGQPLARQTPEVGNRPT